MKNNKAPSPDGLTNKFYKIIGPKLEDTLTAVFNSLLAGEELPLYFNLVLLKVLQIPGRDPEIPGLYRPIFLLNSDYKLYTKILAERLKLILPDIIHEDQSGFILGRHLVINGLNCYAVARDTQTTWSSCNLVTAFNLVAWDHLFESLSRFRAPDGFVSMLRGLYANSSSQILSNSHIFPPFPILQSTRQGCPLSPLLFAVALEPLAIALCKSSSFRGINVGEKEVKLICR